MNTASSFACAHQLRVDLVATEDLLAGALLGLLTHRRPRVGVDHIGAAHGRRRVGDLFDRARPERVDPRQVGVVGAVAVRAADPHVRAEHDGRLGERAGDVVEVADVRRRPDRPATRTTSVIVSTSASACSGWSVSLSMLTIGTVLTAAIRSTTVWSNTRAAITAW